MKKVLFVVNSLGIGGAEKSLVSLLNNFDYKNHEVYIKLFHFGGALISELPQEIKSVTKISMNVHEKGLAWKYLIARVRNSISIRWNCYTKKLHNTQCFWKNLGIFFPFDSVRFDVVIAWGQGNPTHYVAEKVNAKKKIAFINADYVKVGFDRSFDQKFYMVFDNIVMVSKQLYDIMINVFPKFEHKMLTIYDIKDAKLVQKMSKRCNPYTDDDTIKIVTVGRLAWQKNYLLLVQTAYQLYQENVKFIWYIVGEGDERNKIEKWISDYHLEDYVVMLGEKSNPYPYIGNADVYVQTSKYEGYCLALAEARMLNIPVVSTDFEVVYDQIVHEENGLIASMNPHEMARAIIRIITDADLRNRIVNNLSVEKKGNVEEIEKLYQLF